MISSIIFGSCCFKLFFGIISMFIFLSYSHSICKFRIVTSKRHRFLFIFQKEICMLLYCFTLCFIYLFIFMNLFIFLIVELASWILWDSFPYLFLNLLFNHRVACLPRPWLWMMSNFGFCLGLLWLQFLQRFLLDLFRRLR